MVGGETQTTLAALLAQALSGGGCQYQPDRVLTEQDVDDPSQVGPLLDQIPPDIEIDQVTAEGAYDGEPTYQTILACQSNIAVLIPPRDAQY